MSTRELASKERPVARLVVEYWELPEEYRGLSLRGIAEISTLDLRAEFFREENGWISFMSASRARVEIYPQKGSAEEPVTAEWAYNDEEG